MRNLKRVLSLVLATVMLLGMMVMGTSAKDISDFPDADEIDDYAREAVAITTGLGIFTGEAGTGNFNPNGRVTRAQLATIICKIRVLEGTVDYDLLKGSGSAFPDAKTYQGGWAEGYINYCQGLNIVRGYPNGTFGAGDDVVTWHAALALERAIGYYTENEKNGEKLDETVVASKGLEIGLYGDMSLPVDHYLTRQELAVMVYNALFAQRVVYSADRKDYVKANNYNVVPNNSTDDPYNTLAYGTFYLVAEDGVVMRNSAVDPNLSSTDKIGASTMVDMYDDDHELTGVERSFEYETGADLIGHAVTVYYSEAHKVKNVTVPEKVYAMTDQATATGMITYATLSDNSMDYTTMNRAAMDQGFKARSLGADVEKYNINYALDTTVGQTMFKAKGSEPVKKGDYILLISNEANKEVSYAIVLKQYADTISVKEDRFGEENYTISTLSINEFFREDALKDKDKIIVTPNYFDGAGNPKYAVVQKAPTLEADITEISGKSISSVSYKTITADGTVYTESPALSPRDAGTPFQDVTQLGATTLVLDRFGQLIAINQSKAPATTELVYVSQFGYRNNNISSLTDKIVLTAEIWHADGRPSEVITVNTDVTSVSGNTANDVVQDNSRTYWTDKELIAALVTGTGSAATVDVVNKYKELNRAGLEPGKDSGDTRVAYDNGGEFLGVWNIRLREEDGTYILTKPNALNDGGAVNAADISVAANTLSCNKTKNNDGSNKNVYIVKSHSTFLPNGDYNQGATLTGWASTFNDTAMLHQTTGTLYFLVDGNYGDPTFSVRAVEGIQTMDNIILRGEPGTTDGTWAEEAWLDAKNNVLAMVIHGTGAVDDLGVCYYNQGDYRLGTRNGRYTVTFLAYDAAGNEVNFTYEFDSVQKARDAAEGRGTLVNPTTILGTGSNTAIPSGYYTFFSNKIVAVSEGDQYAVDHTGHRNKEVLNGDAYKGTVYVANGTVSGANTSLNNRGSVYNLFTEATKQGFIYTNAQVIDLKTGTYTTVKALYDDFSNHIIKNVNLSYSYSRSNYECAVLYVIDYDFTSVAGGGTGSTGTTVEGAYGDAVVPDPTTPGKVTVRYHNDDLTAYGNLKSYVEAMLGQAAGMTCTYNAISGKAIFSDGSEAEVKIQQMFKITVQVPSTGNTVKSVETYLAADGTNPDPTGSNNEVKADGVPNNAKYIEQGKTGTAFDADNYNAGDGTNTIGMGASAGSPLTHDMVLVPAVTVTYTNSSTGAVTVKLGEKVVDLTSPNANYVPKGASLTVTGTMTTSGASANYKFVGLECTMGGTAKYIWADNGANVQTYNVTAENTITALAEKQMFKVLTPDGKTEYAPASGTVEFTSAADASNVKYLDDDNNPQAPNGTPVAAKSGVTGVLVYTVDDGDVAKDDTITLVERYTLTWDSSIGAVSINGTALDASALSTNNTLVAKGDKVVVTGKLNPSSTGNTGYAGLTITIKGVDSYMGKETAATELTYNITVDSNVTVKEEKMYKVTGSLVASDVIRPVNAKVDIVRPDSLTDGDNFCVKKINATTDKVTVATTTNKTFTVAEQSYTVASGDAENGVITLVEGYEVEFTSVNIWLAKKDSSGNWVKDTANQLTSTDFVEKGANLWVEAKTANQNVGAISDTSVTEVEGSRVGAADATDSKGHVVVTVNGTVADNVLTAS